MPLGVTDADLVLTAAPVDADERWPLGCHRREREDARRPRVEGPTRSRSLQALEARLPPTARSSVGTFAPFTEVLGVANMVSMDVVIPTLHSVEACGGAR